MAAMQQKQQQQQQQQQQANTIPAIAPPGRVPAVGFEVDSVSTGVAVVVVSLVTIYNNFKNAFKNIGFLLKLFRRTYVQHRFILIKLQLSICKYTSKRLLHIKVDVPGNTRFWLINCYNKFQSIPTYCQGKLQEKKKYITELTFTIA